METQNTAVLEKTVKVRNSGIDLLRIIAILLICLSHANQTFRGVVDSSTLYGISRYIPSLIAPFGTFGNILFVICSSYFLVDKAKSRTEKALNILFDSMLISISMLVGFLISGEPLSKGTIIKQIFPDIYGMNWFVPCYVIFYLLSPVVVVGLKNLSKNAHFVIVLLSLLIYGVLSMVRLAPVGSDLLQFFYILNLVAFVKWHCPSIYNYKKLNLILAISGLFITYLGYFGFSYLSKYSSFFSHFSFISMYAPFLIISFICLFNVFCTLKFENKTISLLSSCSLFVYVIHENYLLRTITRMRYYEWFFNAYGYNNAILAMLACGVFMFAAGFILAVIYKLTFSRLTTLLAKKVNNGLKAITNWLYKKIFKAQET